MFLLEFLATLGISRQLESGSIYIPYRFWLSNHQS